MPSMDTGLVQQSTPIQTLNNGLLGNNNDLDNLLERLINVGARISANHPQDQSPQKNAETTTPFNEGVLMDYHNGLAKQGRLIDAIRDQVIKLEQLF